MNAVANTGRSLNEALAEAAIDKRLVVFDYDGTLAHLAVDWEALRAALHGVATQLGIDCSFRPLWDGMATVRDRYGADEVAQLFTVMARYEHAGMILQEARTEIVRWVEGILGARGQGMATLPRLAVFSMNLHATVDEGLRALGIRSAFSWLIGADDVNRWKPDSEGLDTIMNLAGTGPRQSLFVGDSPRDAEAASACGVQFFSV